MLKIKITKQSLAHHFNYMGWLYILLPIAIFSLWSLLYTFTEYRSPPDKVLSFYMVGNIVDNEITDRLEAEIAPNFPTMEEFDFLPILLSGPTDSANFQRFTTLVFAQEGDVYIMDRSLFEQLNLQGAFLPLDGLIQTDIDLAPTTLTTQDDPTPHVYGVNASSLYGFMEHELYDNRDTVLAVMMYTTNPTESIALAQWMMDHRTAPVPANIENWPVKEPFYSAELLEEINKQEQ